MRKSTQKRIQWIIGAVLLADVILAGVNWRIASGPRDPEQELHALRQERALLAADVARGKKIRADLPQIDKAGTAFFQDEILPAQSGYSALSQDFGDLARTAGVRTGNISYRENQPDKRGVIQVEMTATVSGEYPNVVRFINGLEHSDKFYVLDNLSLAAGSSGGLSLNLHLRTYFRTVA